MVGTATKGSTQMAVLLRPVEFKVINWNSVVRAPNPAIRFLYMNQVPAAADIALGDDPTFDMFATVQISIDGEPTDSARAIGEASKWKLKVLQNLVAAAPVKTVYESGTITSTPSPIPALDVPDGKIPEIPFSKNLQKLTIKHDDSPNLSRTFWGNSSPPRTAGVDPLMSVSRDDTFITWLYVEREGGRRIFLKWVKWQAAFKFDFNPTYSGGETKVTFTRPIWIYKKISEGDGEGPSKPSFTPLRKNLN